MRFGQNDDRTIEDCGFHSSPHHRVAEKYGNSTVAVFCRRITEMFLELVPIHRIIGLQEAKIWEQPEMRDQLRHRTLES